MAKKIKQLLIGITRKGDVIVRSGRGRTYSVKKSSDIAFSCDDLSQDVGKELYATIDTEAYPWECISIGNDHNQDLVSKKDERENDKEISMYSHKMKEKMAFLQDKMDQLNQNIKSVQHGTRKYEDIKTNVENTENELTQSYQEIIDIKHPQQYKNLHDTVKKACSYYIQGLRELLEYYKDDNDTHLVTSGNYINKGSELMQKSSDLFKEHSY